MEDTLCPPADPGFRLIETMLWTPDEGVRHRARHLRRLERTARALGIMPRDVNAALDALRGEGPQRVRLTVDVKGTVEIAQTMFTPLAPETIWRVAVHTERLRSSDPWLALKTTRRTLYDAARASLPEGTDEWLFLNTGGALCEGTITNVYVAKDGVLRTPPRACGCLPGIGREVLIGQGRAKPGRLDMNDLRAADEVYVGNALRGLIRAELVEMPG
ncbi:aminotransferase class IV family protein [Roseovarius pelagicus]|uniref:Probable branched-chain-amino-acid aminotransferase n=1 Tax=Roseovarius pelagicus TaxID=2980108 RepID=A0ABY6DE00_9RHOB|nr:aminotransferase class IV family protein [Roseovarius pelagicus]UXX84386.1 aminotransferase class IV family protein [Roseovarius pelagicus]